MSRLKVGVVGVGIGRMHLDGYLALPDAVKVVALCDLDENRLNQVADKYNVPLRYTDYQKMFNSGKIEAVSVCLPNSLHAPVSIAALEAGLHVLCEKPLAENAAAGQKIVEAAERASVKFMVCFNRRYRIDTQWMKQAIEEGMLGEIYQVKAGWIRETGIPGRTGWFTNKKVAGGGSLIDVGVHMLDLVMWLLDYPEPLTVSGDVKSNFGPVGSKMWLHPGDVVGPFQVEDSATAFIRLNGGATFHLETSWASHARPGMDDFFVTLLGSKGSIQLYVANYATENTLTFFTEMHGLPVTMRPRTAGNNTDHDGAVTEFVRCIQDDVAPGASAERGQTIMQMIDAIYRSAAEGREVTLS